MTGASERVSIRLADDVVRRRHAESLASRVSGEVRFGAHDRMLYSTDASLYQVEPMGVVVPADSSDLSAAVSYCAEHGLAMLPRGGGTSLAGQCVAEAVVLDTSPRFRRVGSIDVGSRTCVAGAGATLDDVNRALGSACGDGRRLFFAPDPSTLRQATVGGCIGNNAAGTRSIRYGRTSENLAGVSCVLADGVAVRLGAGSAAVDGSAGVERVREITDEVVRVVRSHAGLIRERFPRTLRRNAGYALDLVLDQLERAEASGVHPYEAVDLAQLVCGSEGTLAFVTEATLKLHPVPARRGLGVLGFASLDDAIGSVERLLELGPSAVELLDDLVVGLARKNLEHRGSVELLPQPGGGRRLEAVLYVEFSAEAEAGEIEARFASLRSLLGSLPGDPALACLGDPAAMERALRLRSAGEPLLHAVGGARKPLGFVEDNAVPVERLGEFVRRFRAVVESHGTRAAFYAHASVGVLHVRPLLDLRDAGDRAAMEDIAVRVADLARELGGVMSGEHGDGRARGPLLERFYGPELMRAFASVKRAFDPAGLLNPGNIVPAVVGGGEVGAGANGAASGVEGGVPAAIGTIHERTRVRPSGEDVAPPEVETFFEYRSEGGFGHAVELCNGSGVCRKRHSGTMCPSYMGTLDERHSTRGRGNALRLAVTGQLPGGDGRGGPLWDDAETLGTLRLCLSCKACKSECPTNVDVAAYKAEYLAQSYRSSGRTPIAARAFGRVRVLNRLGSAFAPLSNWVAGSAPARWVMNGVLGLAPERSLPAFSPSLFRGLRRSSVNAGVPADAPVVVLYADCFTAFNEPGVGVAAASLLNACGYRVAAPDVGCCGRTHVSTGLLGEASSVVRRTSASLSGAVDRLGASAVLVCEPSCLSAIHDEWQDLKTDDATRSRASRLKSMSSLVEDFVSSRWDEHPTRPTFHRPAGRVALHGHCHQKALWSAETSAGLLRRVAGPASVDVLDTGCCGMAGSFGYTADRYELSMRIGELALFPAVRGLGGEDAVVAPGTSCRHQIADGTARSALHPVVYAASLLR